MERKENARGELEESERIERARKRREGQVVSKTLLANNHPKGAPSVSRFLSLSFCLRLAQSCHLSRTILTSVDTHLWTLDPSRDEESWGWW